MKKIFTFILLVMITSAMTAQAPQAFKYQAIARDLTGKVLPEQTVAFRMNILQGSSTGPVVYSERHTLTTNELGLANLSLGTGIVLSGNFSAIEWGRFTWFLKTEIDPSGGTTYQDMGTSQFLSVPYALYSEKSGLTFISGAGINITDNTITNTAPDQDVTITGTGTTTVTGSYPSFTINTPAGVTYTGGTGINVTGSVISNTAPDKTVMMNNGTGISVTGTYPNFTLANTMPNETHTGDATGSSALSVVKIQGKAVSSAVPSTDQVLKWNGTQWTPSTLSTPAAAWLLTGNSGTSPATNFIGTTDNVALAFKVNNVLSGKIETTTYNTSFGYQALQAYSTGNNNTAFGCYAMNYNTSGNSNTALGADALHYNTRASSNLAIGQKALYYQSYDPGSTWNTDNVAVGYEALYKNNPSDLTNGSKNNAVGNFSLDANTTGSNNCAFGYKTLYQNTIGNNNIAIGGYSLYTNQFGNANTAIGPWSLYDNFIGANNSAMGIYSLFNNYNGNENTAVGQSALYTNSSGNGNTAVGSNALYSNFLASNNTAIGNQSLYSNISGSTNTAIGNGSLYGNTYGWDNTAIGNNAMLNNTIMAKNTAVGAQALYTQSYTNNVSMNSYNVAIGGQALYHNQPTSTSNGINNTAVGYDALNSNSTGVSNTASGFNALRNSVTGWQNTSIGANSQINNNYGSYNTAVGYNTGPGGSSYENTTCVGIDATATAGNMVRIGNVYVTSIGGYRDWTNISDERFKENIREDVPGLSFITQLRPVTYQLNHEKINDFNGVNERRKKIKEQEPGAEFQEGDKYSPVTTGFLAQEVEAAAKSIGFDFSGVDAPKNDKDMYGLRYAEFVVPLVKAVQEQQKIIAEMQQKNEELQKQIDDLKAILKK